MAAPSSSTAPAAAAWRKSRSASARPARISTVAVGSVASAATSSVSVTSLGSAPIRSRSRARTGSGSGAGRQAGPGGTAAPRASARNGLPPLASCSRLAVRQGRPRDSSRAVRSSADNGGTARSATGAGHSRTARRRPGRRSAATTRTRGPGRRRIAKPISSADSGSSHCTSSRTSNTRPVRAQWASNCGRTRRRASAAAPARVGAPWRRAFRAARWAGGSAAVAAGGNWAIRSAIPAYGRLRSVWAGRSRSTRSPRAAALAATASSRADLPIPAGPCRATPPPAAIRASTADSRAARPTRVVASSCACVSRAVPHSGRR